MKNSTNWWGGSQTAILSDVAATGQHVQTTRQSKNVKMTNEVSTIESTENNVWVFVRIVTVTIRISGIQILGRVVNWTAKLCKIKHVNLYFSASKLGFPGKPFGSVEYPGVPQYFKFTYVETIQSFSLTFSNKNICYSPVTCK